MRPEKRTPDCLLGPIEKPEWALSFAGKDAAEAEDFIVNARRIAYHYGKQRDDTWMADLAAPCMTGRALRWYEALDDETRDSWALLRRALLSRWPNTEDE